MVGTGNQKGDPRWKKPGMTAQEKALRRKRNQLKREKNRADHKARRDLTAVARGIAKEVPEFANATQILGEIEEIHEHLSSYMNATVAVMAEAAPGIMQQIVESALDGDKQDRRFVIQKLIDIKPLIEAGSFQNQKTMNNLKELLEDEGMSVVAREREIEVRKGDGANNDRLTAG